ncbi:MAG: GLPGLI family protein [bacterium]
MRIILKLYMLLSLFCLKSSAQLQKTYIMNYRGVFNLKHDLDRQFREYRSVLIEQHGISHFFMQPGPTEEGVNEVIIESDSSFRVFKEPAASRLIFGEMDLAGRERYFEDTLHPMRWTLHEEVRQIDSFECRKADAWFRGRHYTAWYAPDIPIPNGPWKMGGLPGLIMELREASGDMHFTLESIRIENMPDLRLHPVMHKSHPDIQSYLNYWRKLVARMKGMAAAQPGADCLTCQTTPSIQIRRWEKLPL